MCNGFTPGEVPRQDLGDLVVCPAPKDVVVTIQWTDNRGNEHIESFRGDDIRNARDMIDDVIEAAEAEQKPTS